MEEQQAPTPQPTPPPAQPQRKMDAGNKTASWALGGVTLGFLLPVCSCAMLMFACFFSISLAGVASPTAAINPVAVGDTVAIVRVEGVITADDGTDFATGAPSGTVINHLRLAADDPNVKAIVIRVNTPGGSVVGSAEIHDVIKEIDKPIVISMFETAASGGYYIAAPADYIFANPDTFTGSIGVIMSVTNIEGLAEEYGVDSVAITSGDNKAIGGLFDALTPEQTEILQAVVDEAFTGFVQVIVDGRGIPEAEVRALADGRIYTGRQALALNLVDELGNFQDAIDKAAELAGISDPNTLEYNTTPSFQDILLGFSSRIQKSEAEILLESFESLSAPRLEYRYIGGGTQ